MALFDEINIFSHREVEARHEILLETYIKKIQIESRIMGDLAINHIIPAAVRYQTELASNVEKLMNIKAGAETTKTQMQMINEISTHINGINKLVDEMIDARKKANKMENIRNKAICYCDEVKSFFDPIRDHVDALEMLVDDEIWPMAKYRELVTIR